MPDVKPTQKTGLLLIGIGSLLTSMVVMGFLLGYGVDTQLNSSPVFMLIFGLLGLIGGMLRAYKMLMQK